MKLVYISVLLGGVLSGCMSMTKHEDYSTQQIKVCKNTNDQEISALFDKWNQGLQSGKPESIVQLYAEDSILLPTLSNKLRFTAAEKEDYFKHFMENSPTGKVETRFIDIGCNTALDTGVYTFSFTKTGEAVRARYSYTYHWNGKQWLITSHHSSLMPEA
ncbi:SgcJ/EcaC family oxidoreductase [Acinetobacter haemolyticus]|uniref:SgcJ/EcaC family oxidoreductase n=1 Tax=Acinetobacter haemolyticus TaxID=29430 RepID=UPI000D69F40F|nr:SgcJ/EcaC family oxidoreductase [Acinetobacter haemolyticus]